MVASGLRPIRYSTEKLVTLQEMLPGNVRVTYSDGTQELIEYGYDPTEAMDGLTGQYIEMWPNDLETHKR